MGAEECDDQNVVGGDGCSEDCVIEVGWNCGAAPSICGAAECGDGWIIAAEACDDGNSDDGDGCSALCELEVGWSCEGEPSSCAASGCGDGVPAGVEQCDDGNVMSGDGCSSTCEVEPGWSCAGAPSSCMAADCGDGLIIGAEACDDGNTTSGDGCSAGCAVEVGWDCSDEPSDCVPSACGDGITVGPEACDDGNTTSLDGCSASCAIEAGWSCFGAPTQCTEICRDGLVVGAEECDDDNNVGWDGCDSCVVQTGWTCTGQPSVCTPICGDGLVEPGEWCDDGNLWNGDGCSSSCVREPGWTCNWEPSSCHTTCGDGIVAGVESCDDGNSTDWDGCTSCDISEFQMDFTPATSTYYATLHLRTDGSMLMGFGANDGDMGGVWSKRFSEIGQPLGPAVQVNTFTTGIQSGLYLGESPDGTGIAVWSSRYQDGDLFGVYAQLYDPLGAPAGGEFRINTTTSGSQYGAGVGVADDGSFIVLWMDGSGGVIGRRFGSDGAPLGSEFRANTGPETGYYPSITMNGDGTFIVAWASILAGGDNTDVWAQRFDAQANPVGSNFPINTYTTNEQWRQVVKMRTDGSFVVVWNSMGQDGDGWGVYGQRFDSLGGAVGGEFQVNTTTSYDQEHLDLAVFDTGGFIVAWDGAYAINRVYVQRYDAGGTPIGSEFAPHVYQGGSDWPSVATKADGSFVIAWGSSANGGGTFAQRFDAAGNALGKGP